MSAGIAADFNKAAVVVTGVGNAGQAGEIVAVEFGRRGATVHCIDRGEGVVARVADLRAQGIAAVPHQLDLTDFAAVAAVADAIAKDHGGQIAAVAALAGGFGTAGTVAESTPDLLARQFTINATTAYATARAFAPYVRAAKGAFVFVAAAAVLPGGKVSGMAAYAMAKGAVMQLVYALAEEEREHGVRVNAVAPTAIRTAANIGSMGDGVRYVEREEFAQTIVALCTPDLQRVTGQVIRLA